MRLFEPVQIGAVSVRNRLMMTVHGPRLSESRYLRYLDERSRDVGLVGLHAFYGVANYPFGPGPALASYAADFDAVPPHPLSADGRAYYDRAIPTMSAQVDVVHRNGAVAVGQILHIGGSQHSETFQPAVGPSDVQDEFRPLVPHALTVAEITDFVQAWGEAGGRAQRAGLDGIEVHAAHGYLLNQFLSPLTNTRDDVYGGSLDNRMRLLLEILDALRASVGPGFAIGVRIPGRELAEGGLTIEEMSKVGQRLAMWGVAYLNVTGGTYTGLQQGARLAYVAPSYVAPGPNVASAAAIRACADGVPVIVAGRFIDLMDAEEVVSGNSADLVGLTRALIADPRIVHKMRTGQHNAVVRCVGCNECHYGRSVTCAVNPAAGREAELEMVAAARPRRVLVVGGGPAGMECARVAATRGHHVRLVDNASELGGTLRVVGRDPNRAEFIGFLDVLARQLEELGVDIGLGRHLEPDEVRAANADVVVLATGSVEWVPPVPGVDRLHVGTALSILRGEGALGRHVVVVGGLDDHLPPLTTADFIADGVRRVTLLSEGLVAGQGIEPATLFALTRRLLEKGVSMRPMSALHEVRDDAIVIRNTMTNALSAVNDVDSVVLACGRRPQRALADALEGTVPALRLIGDCLSPRRLVHATLDGARQGVCL